MLVFCCHAHTLIHALLAWLSPEMPAFTVLILCHNVDLRSKGIMFRLFIIYTRLHDGCKGKIHWPDVYNRREAQKGGDFTVNIPEEKQQALIACPLC